jgi:cellobiose phosphorylase
VKSFSTKYGHFSEDGKEYIITSPRTPRPWINVISNGDYGLTLSQAGSGYSWRTHAQLNRLTRWEQDLIKDEWGKYIYLADDQGHIWSAGWKPVCSEPDAYRCRHGIGYSVIESLNHGIASELLISVSNDEPAEIWKLVLTNRSRRARTLNLYSYFEWGLGQAPDWHREFHRSFVKTEFEPAANALLATKQLWEVPTDRGHWNTEWPFVAFHASSLKPASYETDKEGFLGMYGGVASPAGIRIKRLGRKTGDGLDPVASLHGRVTIEPGRTVTVIYTLGCADTREQAITLAKKYQSAVEVESALTRVGERWDRLLGTVTVGTPDDSMNVMENTWLKYQAISGRMWGRTAYYQTGGAYGFRDQLQDSQLWLSIDPAQTRKQVLLHARHQFIDGTVYHWWHPLSETGLHNRISDNLLWMPYVLHAYLQETADTTILDDREPFVDSPDAVPLYEHCTKAIDRALTQFSDRGLPLIGEGDWNDGLSAVGLDMRGESVWLGHFLHRILLDFVAVAGRRGDQDRARRYRERAATLRQALNTVGWDGGYYYGATKDSGERLGSRTNAEGTVWLNPQTWAIIGGVADEQRSNTVFDVVENRLEFDTGPLLLHPAYATPDRNVGYLTRYSPGLRENGGVYTHAATWAIVAAAMLGRGESAFRIYSKLNPVNRGKHPERYRAEPYVTAGNIEGPESSYFGRGGWTWYTGSAAWLYKAGLEWILGIRATYDGLVVDPCIPPSWNGFTARRVFRGVTYEISVLNPEHVVFGVQEVRVDGRVCCESMSPRTKVLPLFEQGTTHEVTITLGESR